MSRSTDVIALPSAAPDIAPPYTAADTEIAHAITRAQDNLLQQQRPDGHWCGELIVDSTLCSDFVLFMHWFGEVDEELQQRCVRHILKRQLPMGVGTFIMAARARSTLRSKRISRLSWRVIRQI